MSVCIKRMDGEHRLEVMEFKSTETLYRCLDCGEQEVRYEDNHGC